MTDDANKLYLFDANCMLGRTIAPKPGFPQNVRQLLAVMDRFGIAEAAVYHAQSLQYDAAHGNAALTAEIEGIERLHAVWVLLPDHTGEFPDADVLFRDAEDEHTAPEETAAEPACDAAEPDAASADAADEDAMPPVVSDLVEDGEDEAAELDKLLDDIINAAE